MVVRSIFYSTLLILLLSFCHNLYLFFKCHPIPAPEDVWWGTNTSRNEGSNSNTKIREFKIQVNAKEIKDIYHRLNLTRYPTKHDGLRSNTHEYGMNPSLIKQLLKFIKEKYNFKQRVDYLNSYPQYITNIQGINIHFVHIRPKNIPEDAKKVNILFLHGWPSGPSEFFSLIPLFSTNKKYIFEIVIPSLPGFGYSEAPENMHVKNIAVIFKNLMVRLNLEKFYIHGTDWGSVVGSTLSTLYPDNVLGYHSNFCLSVRYVSLVSIYLGSLVPWWTIEEKHRSRLYPLTDLIRFYLYETGYLHILGTKPDTMAIGLDNSLEGLLAFNLEKWSVGADKNNIYLENGGLDVYHDMEKLLDIQIFYYWLPIKYTTAARIYSDNLNLDGLSDPVHHAAIDSKVPCGCVYFQNEFLYFPEFILKHKFSNLTHYKTYDFGGHFSAMEKNTYKQVYEDLLEFITKTFT